MLIVCGIKTTSPDNKTEQRAELNIKSLLFYSLSFQSKYSRSLCTDCYFNHKIESHHAIRAVVTKNRLLQREMPKRIASTLSTIYFSHRCLFSDFGVIDHTRHARAVISSAVFVLVTQCSFPGATDPLVTLQRGP